MKYRVEEGNGSEVASEIGSMGEFLMTGVNFSISVCLPCNTSLKSLEDLNFIGILNETPPSSLLTNAAVALLMEELKKIGVETGGGVEK